MRYTGNIKNYPWGAGVFPDSDYVEYNDGYTIGVESLFGRSQKAVCYAEKENDFIKIRLTIIESLTGGDRYSIEYQSQPVIIYEDEEYEYYRNTYEKRGKFDIDTDGKMTLSCGSRQLEPDEIKQAEAVINDNYDMIRELCEISNKYWKTTFTYYR